MNTTWKTEITEMLEIKYPIIQAPMFGVTTPGMTAAASQQQCLGSLPLGDVSAENCRALIREVKKITDKKFAVNLFVNDIPPITIELREKYIQTADFVTKLAARHHLNVNLPSIEDLTVNSYQEQIDAIIEENCKIVSFTFGNLDTSSIEKLKSNGVILIGTCTSAHEAVELEKSGIDILCVQGLEAGGHRGSFAAEPISQSGGFSLLPQVYHSVSIPIIYAGGIYNANTLIAAKILGAKGFQLGSVFLASPESALLEFEKYKLMKAGASDSVLTKGFSGRYARGLKNIFTSEIDNSGHILPYPYQNKLTQELRRTARVNKAADFVNIWAGESIHGYSKESTKDILKKLIIEVENFSLTKI